MGHDCLVRPSGSCAVAEIEQVLLYINVVRGTGSVSRDLLPRHRLIRRQVQYRLGNLVLLPDGELHRCIIVVHYIFRGNDIIYHCLDVMFATQPGSVQTNIKNPLFQGG